MNSFKSYVQYKIRQKSRLVHRGLQQKKDGICKIYYLCVTVITPDIRQI